MTLVYLLNQIGNLLILRTILPLFIKLRIEGREHLEKIREPVILIANHNSRLDPVLMTIFLPWHLYRGLLPFRFMTVGFTMRKPRSIPWLWLIGCYGVEPGNGSLDEVLQESMKIVTRTKHALVMFPEAKMHKTGNPPPARPGIAYLAKHSGRLIVPVGLSGLREMGWLPFWTFRGKVTIRFGPAFHYTDIVKNDEDLRKAAELMMDEVYELLD